MCSLRLAVSLALLIFRCPNPKRYHRTENVPDRKVLEMPDTIKLKAFRIASAVSTLAMLIAATGAGKKWW